MISSLNTTDEWQQFSSNLAVLPMGAFEQHGPHLPLDTDIRGAEYFARHLADETNAALLAPQPYGTSLEHSGFRGTMTLQPQTLSRLLEDIAENLESQAFRFLVLVNGHGGNFCIGPTVRAWNRADRTLKILIVNWWEFCDPALLSSASLDIHAGDFETSVMLAIAPELVRIERISDAQSESRDEQIPLRQSDLNSFGVGHFSCCGAIGDAKSATTEKGQAIVSCVHKNMLDFVRDRLERLENMPRYSGRGGIAVRIFEEYDLDAALHLKTLVKWNQTSRDLRFFLAASPKGNYVAVHNGRVIGTTATIRYEERVAWIGMVIVDPEFRGLGVGRMLLNKALEDLNEVPCVKLDATPDGRKLYETLGFAEESTLRRWVCPTVRAEISQPSTHFVRKATQGDWDAIIALDAQTFGARRPQLLRSLLEAAPFAWCSVDENGDVSGFCLGREGANYTHIGPIIAPVPEAANSLLAAALRALNGRAALVDVPDEQTAFIQEIQRLGFFEQRPLVRMRKGKETPAPQSSQLFAICGPEFG